MNTEREVPKTLKAAKEHLKRLVAPIKKLYDRLRNKPSSQDHRATPADALSTHANSRPEQDDNSSRNIAKVAREAPTSQEASTQLGAPSVPAVPEGQPVTATIRRASPARSYSEPTTQLSGQKGKQPQKQEVPLSSTKLVEQEGSVVSVTPPKTVILIEDNNLILASLKRAVETKWFGKVNVKTARSAGEGVSAFKAAFDTYIRSPADFGKRNIVVLSDDDLGQQPTPKDDRQGIDALNEHHGIAAIREMNKYVTEKEKERGLDSASLSVLKQKQDNGELLNEEDTARLSYTRPKFALNTTQVVEGKEDDPVFQKATKAGADAVYTKLPPITLCEKLKPLGMGEFKPKPPPFKKASSSLVVPTTGTSASGRTR